MVHEQDPLYWILSSGTSPEYEERLQELIEEREATIHKANLLREYQLEMSEKIFEEEVAQAEEDYEVCVERTPWPLINNPINLCHTLVQRERQELIDKLLADIEERRKKLQEERNNSDLMHGINYIFYTSHNFKHHCQYSKNTISFRCCIGNEHPSNITKIT